MLKILNKELTVTPPSLTRRVTTWLTLIAYVGQPLVATAQIVAAPDAPANTRPVIDTTANGIPLVQIAAPNSTGLSHNQFSQYNVDPNGVILNNSNTTVLTQQAGYVPGNQNMANGTARIILNEVTGTSASQLNGYTEVAGSRVEVIIANPNGIACNGCGFINTSRGVLTTGVPVFGGSGSLDAFRVTGGQISVDAGGLNGNNTDQLDLIARSVRANGNLWANNLNVVTGANQVNYANLGVQIITGSGNKPTVGIDVAQLGGMYANKIRLVGTEAGVGVNSSGTLAAQAGDFTLDNQGQITLGGSTTASGNISINSNTGITNTGTLSSQQTAQLASTGNILNDTGATLSSGNVVLNTATGDITNNGYLYGNQVNTLSNNLYNNFSIIGNVVNLASNNLYNTGSAAFIGATQTANLVVANAFANTGGADINSLGDINIGSDVTVQTSGYLTGNAVSVLNQSSTIEATGNLRLAAGTIDNQRTVVGLEYGPSWAGTPVVNTPVVGGPTVYSYTPTYANQQFTATTAPAAQFLSGTSMSISGSTLNNNYSSIITGGTLIAQMTINNNGPEFLKSETRSGISSVWASTYHPQQGSCGFISNGCVNAYVSWALVTTPYSSTQIPTPISGLNYTRQGNSSSAYLAAKSSSTVALPTSSLFTIHPQPGQPYLVVTDPRFANYANFVSSDYMLSRLSLDPQQMQMRLGDGFYEQQLVTQQIIANTGHIYLGGYSDAQSQFIALMNSGIDAAQDFNLTIGVALSAAQINSLKHDIVWMVDREVTLPNGTVEHVLAPQVYLSSLQEADLKPSGALIAANVININSSSIDNSGTIRAYTALSINANDITNRGGTISSGGSNTLVAGNDILNLSGNISGTDVSLSAGRDISNALTGQSVTRTFANGTVNGTDLGTAASINATNSLSMNAGRDVSINGASVNAGGDATINAGRNLAVGMLTATDFATANQNAAYDKIVTQHTSSIQAGGNLTLASGSDMHLTSAALGAGKDAVLVSGGDLTIDASKNSTSSGYNTGSAIGRFNDETVLGSTLKAGGNVTLVATQLKAGGTTQGGAGGSTAGRSDGKGNITLQSTDIASKTGTLTVAADANVNIGTTAEHHDAYTESHATGSSLFTHTTLDVRNESSRTDNIGSNLNADSIGITSGKNINVVGSTASAGHDINVAAMGDVNLAAATNTYSSDHYSHETTTGLQFSGGNPFGITNMGPDITSKAHADGTKQSFSRTSFTSNSGNLSVMAGGNLIAGGTDLVANAGDLALTAGGTVALLAGQDTLNQNSSTVTVTNPNAFTKQHHTITDTYSSLDNQGSTAQGNSIKISSGGDTVLQAAQVKSGAGGININAGGDVKLLAAANSASSTHTETLSTDGVNVDGSLNGPATRRINNKAESQTQTAQVTQLASLGDITTHSGSDTTLEGSKLNAAGSINLSAGNAPVYNADGSLNSAGTQGNLVINGAMNSVYENVQNSGSSSIWQHSYGSGQDTQTLKLANITAGKGLTANATGGIQIQVAQPKPAAPPPPQYDAKVPSTGSGQAKLIPPIVLTSEQQAAKNQVDLNAQINALASQPGQAWISQLAKQNNATFNQVKLAAQNWNYSESGLTAEAAAVIVIVVAYFTAGAGSGAVGTTTAVGGTTTTAVGGTTLAATTTTAAGVSVTTYTAAGAAINAGFTVLASEATISAINNKGDIEKTLQDLGNNNSVKNIVAAMLTAGVGQEFANTYNVGSFTAKVATGCAAGAISGIGCNQGATVDAVTSAAAWGYNSLVGYSASALPGNTPAPGTNSQYPFYAPDKVTGQQPLISFGNDVIGFNKPGSIFSQGGTISNALNDVPFINATAGLHDWIFNSKLLPFNGVTNIGTMLPALSVALPAALNDPTISWMTTYKPINSGRGK